MPKKKLDKPAREFLKLMEKGLDLGGEEFSREEIYETSRY